MANNRMYLKCDLCGQEFYLAKYFPATGWYIYARDKDNDDQFSAKLPTFEDWTKAISAFLSEHSPLEHTPHVMHTEPTNNQCNLGDTFTLRYE